MTETQTSPHLESSAYAQHLAAVNERQEVRAHQDVYSVHGVLVAKKGAPIDYDTARKIVRHKLTMPLDKSVELENTISASGLLRRFYDVAEKFGDVQEAHQNLQLDRVFDAAATKLILPPILAQKLTVMNLRQTELTDQTLMGAWIAVAVGRAMAYDEAELALVYLAAISRDLGMLHVDPSLLQRPSDQLYGPEDWRALQSHVVASHMILQECEGIPDRLMNAVIQHHENADGTGYPTNLMVAELTPMGQILSIADTVAALRIRRFQGSGRNLRDTQSILRVDTEAYRGDVHDAMFKVFAGSGVRPTRFHEFESRDTLVRTLHRRARAMVSCGGLLADMPEVLETKRKRLGARVTSAFVTRLENTIARSGLGDGELVKWLTLVVEGAESTPVETLAEIDLQQREVLWQLRRLRLSLEDMVERNKSPAQGPARALLDRMTVFFEQLENGVDGPADLTHAPADSGEAA